MKKICFFIFASLLTSMVMPEMFAQEQQANKIEYALMDINDLFSFFDTQISSIEKEHDMYRRVTLYIQLCHTIKDCTWLQARNRMQFLDQLFCHMIMQINHKILTLMEHRESLKASASYDVHTEEIKNLNALVSSLSNSIYSYKRKPSYNHVTVGIITGVSTLAMFLTTGLFVLGGNKIRERFFASQEEEKGNLLLKAESAGFDIRELELAEQSNSDSKISLQPRRTIPELLEAQPKIVASENDPNSLSESSLNSLIEELKLFE